MGAVIIPGLSFATSPNPMFYSRLKSSSILLQSLPGCTVQQRHRQLCLLLFSAQLQSGHYSDCSEGKKNHFLSWKKLLSWSTSAKSRTHISVWGGVYVPNHIIQVTELWIERNSLTWERKLCDHSTNCLCLAHTSACPSLDASSL